VSAFGISGTNAHVIVEQAPQDLAVARTSTAGTADDAAAGTAAGTADDDAVSTAAGTAAGGGGVSGAVAWVVSGRGQAGVQGQAGRLLEFVQDRPGLGPAEVAVGLGRRAGLERRAVVVGSTRAELLTALGALARGEVNGTALSGGGLGFVFTGQGSQRVGMAKGLYDVFPTFARELDTVAGVLSGLLGRDLLELVFAGGPELDETRFAQPALFAVEVALFRWLAGLGVVPDAVVGHSVGGLAAAHVAGLWSLADAGRLVVARGAVMQSARAGGAMVAVSATEAEVAASLESHSWPGLGLAAVNGPASVVVSGDRDAAAGFASWWREQGRRVKQLTVSHAFHSHHMDQVLADFHQALVQATFTTPTLDLVSDTTGRLATFAELSEPGYWTRHIREAVRFHDAVRTLRGLGVSTFLELGPDAVLTALVREALDEETGPDGSTPVVVAQSLLRRGRPEDVTALTALGAVHTRGHDLAWPRLWPRTDPAELPTYAFQRRRYWTATPTATATGHGLTASGHPLLGAVLERAEDGGLLLTGQLSLTAQPWLADHTILGTVLLPGTAFLDLALTAGQRVGADLLAELTLEAPLVLGPRTTAQVQVALAPADADGRRALTVHARTEQAREKICAAGGPANAAMAAPSLAEALGTSRPTLETKRTGSNMFDTLTGNAIQK